MTSEVGRSRAVLFGVHDFDELPSLDGVRHNVSALSDLLTSDDVGALAPEDCTVVPADGTQQHLLDSIHDAAREATDLLLIYYAGHGHFGGHDRAFLLATRGSSAQRPYHSVKYSDIRDLVSRSPAQRKVVVIDCCFSGRALAMSDEQAPTQLDVEITGACVLTSAAETERSLCLPEGSVFTVELATLLRDGLRGELSGGRRGEHLPDLTMTDVFNALHTRLQDRTVEGLRVPQPRMSTRDLGHQIVIARNRAYTGPPETAVGVEEATAAHEHPWVVAVRDHPLWNYVVDERGLPLLRDVATSLAAAIATGATREGGSPDGDPWHSPAFTDRLAEWIDSLLLDSSVRPQELELSAAEVFLLVTHPYLHAQFRRHNTGLYRTIDPTNLADARNTSRARSNYESFLRRHSRLVRRALRGTDDVDASDAIGWWLFHRWLLRQPGLYEAAAVEVLLDGVAVPLGKHSPREKRLVADVLDPSLIARLLSAPQLLGRSQETQVPPRSVGAAETAQRVRTQPLAELLRIAHLFAVDPVALPDVVADHIGIGYAVDLPELHRTLDGVRWQSHGRTRVLNATCRHLAVELGLRQHAVALDTLLARIDIRIGEEERPALLRNVPLHATADQVAPATEPDGRAAYESTELRFRLADDRVQELLMGEQLYGDPALAVRELYQNALDACRYRDARTAYLRATGAQPLPYKGAISFTQGVDENGPYLECRDNGIGMGETELRDVFSHAGMRFADLPEFVEEMAQWKKENIELHPNSQFGVGVLSYFMLADDITVTTCRLTPEGLPGEHLRVEIAGPGSLFRIQRLERCPDAYTSVRLRLRSADTVSCVDVLRRILWLSDFDVTAADERGAKHEWAARVLSDAAPLGDEDPHQPQASRTDGVTVVPTSTHAVWWCDTDGAVLADGLWAGTHFFGAVVNLTGAQTPRLTVDRRSIIGSVTAEVERLLRQEIPSLLAAGDTVLRHHWLAELLEYSLVLADEVFAAAVKARFTPWRIAGREVDITECGYSPRDSTLVPNASRYEHYSSPEEQEVAAFRAEALTRAGLLSGITTVVGDPVVLPIPSDNEILGPVWGSRILPVTRSDAVSGPASVVCHGLINQMARETGRSPEQVIIRLEQLGFRTASLPFPEVEPVDLRLMRHDFTVGGLWRDPEQPVHPGDILQAAAATGLTTDDVTARLRRLGFRTPEHPVPPMSPDDLTRKPDDRQLVSLNLDAQAPWLDPRHPVGILHVARAVTMTGWSADYVVERLRQFGFRTSDTAAVPSVGRGDLRLMSRYLTEEGPWIDEGVPLHPAHLTYAANLVGESVTVICDRLTRLGYTPPVRPALRHGVIDLRLMSEGGDAQPSWLSPDKAVSPAHVARIEANTLRPFAELADRLEELGYHLPANAARPSGPDDLRIMSRDLDSMLPWLDLDEPVLPFHLLKAAERVGTTPRAVALRLRELGHRLPEYLDL
ncbi:caspase family protein [Streptomyces sp. NPDC085596]|uniref:caspase, EACC1-associated type n=1 Tax=Streptomyces sp. NPDC085596 TaxID=3365731 RepID=UPI0037D1F1C2